MAGYLSRQRRISGVSQTKTANGAGHSLSECLLRRVLELRSSFPVPPKRSFQSRSFNSFLLPAGRGRLLPGPLWPHISPRAAPPSKVSSVGSPGFLGLFVDSHVAHAFLLGTPCICGDVLFVLRLLKWLSYRCPQHPASPPSPPFTGAMVILHTTETPQRPRGSFFHSGACFNCVCVKQTLKKCFLNDQNNRFI